MNEPPRVLVTDDDPQVRLGSVRILKGGGYEVLEASNGKECVEVVQQKQPDLVLLDVVMPDMEGHEVCRTIKEHPQTQGVFVMLVSGVRTSSEDRSDGLDMGADGYITRPIPNRELLSRVAAALRLKCAEDSLRLEKERLEESNARLEETLLRVKRLEGIVHMCMHCHKIQTDERAWQELSAYIQEHSDAVISHGMCMECLRKHYPEYSTDDMSDT